MAIVYYQIGIQYPYTSIVPDRREAASHIDVLSIILFELNSSLNPIENYTENHTWALAMSGQWIKL